MVTYTRRVRQPIVATAPRGLAQHEHFGMCGRIDGRDRLVERARDDPIVDDEHGANRHFARSGAAPRLARARLA